MHFVNSLDFLLLYKSLHLDIALSGALPCGANNGTVYYMPISMSISIVSRSAATLVLGLACIVYGFGQTPGQGRGRGRGPADTLVSPEVHPDRTVTFRLRAPQANDVSLTGDWMATLEASTGGATKMTKDASGIWTFTSPPLEATMHLYFFTVDGMTMADPVNPDVKLRVRTSGSLVEVPGDPAPVWQMQEKTPHGSVDLNWHHSEAYHDYHEFAVYLPPGYYKSNTRYPVLYLVHGAGDIATSWTHPGAANVILDNLIAQKKAVPMIIVMPFNGSNNPNPPAQGGGRGAGPSPFDEYLTKELIPLIDSTYRTMPNRKSRAMAGLSAGGGATYNVGLKHTELFSQFGFFSAAGVNGQFATRYPELADEKAAASKLDLIWIGVGEQDPLKAGSQAFDEALTGLKIRHTFLTREGGHVWPVWRWALGEFAPLLFRKS
jgi:enterochelin esterase-like enzyme